MPKALILHAFNEYGDLSALSLDELPLPSPQGNEVLIDVAAFALNFGDFELFTGDYTFKLDLPARIGDECAGTVLAVGPDVTGFAVGDRVSTLPCIYDKNGVNGEFALYDARFVAHYPDNLTPEQACTIWVAYFTAYAALNEVAQVQKNDYVLITAASSSAGIAAMELCRMAGAKTIGTSRTAAKRGYLLDIGFDHVIAQDEGGISKKIMAISQNQGVRIIYDPIGGKIVQDYKDALAQNAIIFLYGGMDQNDTVLPEIEMTIKNACLRPFSVFNYVIQDELRARGIRFIQNALASGQISARVGPTYALDDYMQAMNDQLNGAARKGKMVITT